MSTTHTACDGCPATEITTCSGCGRAAHASETDDDDQCTDCAATPVQSQVTGETITDSQIRDLSERAGSLDGDEDFIRELCKRALAPKRYISAESRRRARSRCADIINACLGARP